MKNSNNDNNRLFKYTMEITEDDLDDYVASEPKEMQDGRTGTVVEFYGINEEVLVSNIMEQISKRLILFKELAIKQVKMLVYLRL